MRATTSAQFLCCLSSGAGNEQMPEWRVGEEGKTPISLSLWFPLPRDHDFSYRCHLSSCGLPSHTVPPVLIRLQKQQAILIAWRLDCACLMKGQVPWGRTGWCASGKAGSSSAQALKLQNQQLIALWRAFVCLHHAYATEHAMKLFSIHPSLLSVISGIIACRLFGRGRGMELLWLVLLITYFSVD